MNIQAETPVGQIVAAQPLLAKVFETYGIDYCCGGKKPLEQACRERHVDPQLVLEELRKNDARRGPERDWAALGLTRLADHIEQTHHDYLRQELPTLFGRLTALGFTRPQLREAALELLHGRQVSPAAPARQPRRAA